MSCHSSGRIGLQGIGEEGGADVSVRVVFVSVGCGDSKGVLIVVVVGEVCVCVDGCGGGFGDAGGRVGGGIFVAVGSGSVGGVANGGVGWCGGGSVGGDSGFGGGSGVDADCGCVCGSGGGESSSVRGCGRTVNDQLTNIGYFCSNS